MFERAKHPDKTCYKDGGCLYFRPLANSYSQSGGLYCCHYMFVTGEKRESDPFNCNKFKKRYK